MVYLVPQLVGFIKEMGGTLPLHTRALIAVSHFCVHYWYLIIIVPLAIFFVIKTMAATNPRVRYLLDSWKMKIWMIGPVLKKNYAFPICEFLCHDVCGRNSRPPLSGNLGRNSGKCGYQRSLAGSWQIGRASCRERV